jgi:hypothetical protein
MKISVPIAIAALGLLLPAGIGALSPRVACAQTFAGDASAELVEGKWARTSDVLLGQNKKGPYHLRYKGVRGEGVRVLMDGKELPAGEFSLDAGKGALSFRKDFKQTSIARVDYLYDPLRVQRNPQHSAPGPVTLSLLQTSGASLQITALPGGDGARPGGELPAAAALVMRMSGKMGLFGGGLTSEVLFGAVPASSTARQGGAARTIMTTRSGAICSTAPACVSVTRPATRAPRSRPVSFAPGATLPRSPGAGSGSPRRCKSGTWGRRCGPPTGSPPICKWRKPRIWRAATFPGRTRSTCACSARAAPRR